MARHAFVHVAFDIAQLAGVEARLVKAAQVVAVVLAGVDMAGVFGKELEERAVPQERVVVPVIQAKGNIERIEQARQTMEERLDKPLTLDYLATIVGINKNKLKDGMIYLYNATPTELLLELRMTKALTLLETGLQVSQVAWRVGYKYANNFTVAFTRYYGKSPKALFGKRVVEP